MPSCFAARGKEAMRARSPPGAAVAAASKWTATDRSDRALALEKAMEAAAAYTTAPPTTAYRASSY